MRRRKQERNPKLDSEIYVSACCFFRSYLVFFIFISHRHWLFGFYFKLERMERKTILAMTMDNKNNKVKKDEENREEKKSKFT